MPPYADLRRPGVDEAAFEAAVRDEVTAYVREHPTYPAAVVFWTSARMLELTGAELNAASAAEAGVGRRFAGLNRLSFWALALLAIAGAFTAAMRAAPRWLWLFPALLWLGVAVVNGATRYRVPVDPFLIVPAAVAVASLLSRPSAAGAR